MSKELDEKAGATTAASDLEPSRPAPGKAPRTADLVSPESKGALIVESGGSANPNQLDKQTFLALLKQGAMDVFKQELGSFKMAFAGPKLDKAFAELGNKTAPDLERLMYKFCPLARSASSASAALPMLLAELRTAVKTYVASGEFPANAKLLLSSDVPGGGSTKVALAGPSKAPVDALAAVEGDRELA